MYNQEVYLIYGNYSAEMYSEEIKCFGIYTDKGMAEREAEYLEKEMIEAAEERAKNDSYLRPNRIWVKVVPVRMDMTADIYLGGYTE